MFPTIFEFGGIGGGCDLVGHGKRGVFFTVEKTRGERDGRLGNNFLDEDDAATDFAIHFATNIKAEIRFFECRVKRHSKLAKHFCLEEKKADEADVNVSVEGVQSGAARHKWSQQSGVQRIIQENQVEPLGREKDVGRIGHDEIESSLGWIAERTKRRFTFRSIQKT